MGLKRNSSILVCAFLALFAFLLSACSAETSAPSPNLPDGAVLVDPVFRELHRALGGSNVLGYAISPLFNQGEARCQYTENALMCYNPLLPQQNRYYLAPLGEKLTQTDTPQPITGSGRSRVVNGYIIFDEFVPLYDHLYGERYVGRPLSQVRFNQAQNRYEQFFENLGFYRRLDEPAGQVHLVPYGAARCGLDCNARTDLGAAVGPASMPEIYLSQINRLGGTAVFGPALTAPFTLPDGTIVQVYERAVFSAPHGDLSDFGLKPAPLILGTAFSLPSPRINDSRMVFHPVQGNLGYNVPVIFDQFIARHGNTEISGRPVSEIMKVDGQNLYRQCFENYCLDFDPSAPPELAIRLASIGQAFIDHYHLDTSVPQKFIFARETVLLEIGEASPQVAVGEPQTFYLVVLQRHNHQPLPGVRAILSVFLPDGSVVDLDFPATGADGKAGVVLAPQDDIPNGSVVPYQVCLDIDSQQPICDTETYLVWNAN